MTEKTKHVLIVGGGLILTVAVAIVVYKNYQASSSASQAAADQQNDDALAYLEASSVDDPYAYEAAGGASISVPASTGTTGAAQSIADELSSIEQAFGLAPPSSDSSSTGDGSSTTASAADPTASTPVRPAPSRVTLDDSAPMLHLESDGFV